jgi:hypothetical protein
MGIRATLLKSVESEAKKAGDDLIAKMQIIDDHVITQQENLKEFEDYLLKFENYLINIQSRLSNIENQIREIKHNNITEEVEDV